MNHILIVISFIFVFIFSISYSQERETFEGTIKYHIAFEPNINDSAYSNYIQSKFGDLVETKISKNGSFLRSYKTTSSRGYDFVFYNSKTNILFTKYKNIDTLIQWDCSENGLNLISEQSLKDTTLFNTICAGYKITGIDPKGGQYASLIYYYPKNKEYINPKLYSSYNDFFTNKTSQLMKSPFYLLIMDLEYFKLSMSIEKVTQEKIDLDEYYNLTNSTFTSN
jgi:hypothetical protein